MNLLHNIPENMNVFLHGQILIIPDFESCDVHNDQIEEYPWSKMIFALFLNINEIQDDVDCNGYVENSYRDPENPITCLCYVGNICDQRCVVHQLDKMSCSEDEHDTGEPIILICNTSIRNTLIIIFILFHILSLHN